jgi:hypothetical protein
VLVCQTGAYSSVYLAEYIAALVFDKQPAHLSLIKYVKEQHPYAVLQSDGSISKYDTYIDFLKEEQEHF